MAVADVLWFVDIAWDGMVAIVRDLGDDGANVRPYEDANSPFCLLTHCLGMADDWSGAIAGRPLERDRAAEFRASGPVAPLLARVPVLRTQVARDLESYQPDAPPRRVFTDDWLPQPMTQRGCLLHLLEEVAQHHGQMQVLRDLIARA